MKKVLLFLSAVLVSAAAQAKVAGPIWACELHAENMSGAQFGFILSAGGSEASDVTITCSAPGEKDVVKKGAMVITRLGIGLGISFPVNMTMHSVVVGLVNPNELFGDYHIGASANATVVAVEGGVVLSTGLDNGLSLQLGLYSGQSIGLAISPLQALFIQILTPEQYKTLKAQQGQGVDPAGNGNN
ncbi:MAG: hypothetical protein K2Q26_05880 [Bdellovibrionales bacterium]|nr:hypothetical protein [Bdellovibrionales bacterium]